MGSGGLVMPYQVRARTAEQLVRRLRWAAAMVVLVFCVGVAGYMLIERWSFLSALYTTVITVTTVGFHEVARPSPTGQVFTICLILGGVGTLGYSLGTVVEFMVEGHLTGIIEGRRMQKEVTKTADHFIVCGFGRVGRQVSKELETAGERFVVIENNPERAEACRDEGYLCIEGDASEDLVLEVAGVVRARALIAAVDTDADNVFVTLSARVMNPSIFIVARANVASSEHKLRKAGANEVILPTVIGGRQMAAWALETG